METEQKRDEKYERRGSKEGREGVRRVRSGGREEGRERVS